MGRLEFDEQGSKGATVAALAVGFGALGMPCAPLETSSPVRQLHLMPLRDLDRIETPSHHCGSCEAKQEPQ